MFCPKCGKENQENTTFCIYCGNKLPVFDGVSGVKVPSVSDSQVVTEMTSDAHRNLGGWLAALSYGRLLIAALELVICFVVTFISTCFEYHQNGSKSFIGLANFARVVTSARISGETILCYGGLFAIFLCIFLFCCSIVMHRKIKSRKTNCMNFYRGVAVVISCVDIAGLIAAYLLINRNSGAFYSTARSYMAIKQSMPIAGIALCLLLDMVISLLIFSAYFKTSKRVKVYFETKQ